MEQREAREGLSPSFAPVRQTGSRARGFTYERKVGAWLRALADQLGFQLLDHPWIKTDFGWCQPDFILESSAGCRIVVEVKLSQVDCRNQIQKYKKAAQAATGVQITRRLARGATPVSDLLEANDHDVFLLWL